MRKFLILIYIPVLILTGCSAYVPAIKQGNIVEQEEFEQIKPGMTRKQVQFILGTPLLVDPFRQDRWDYVYFILDRRTQTRDFQRITLFFDGDILEKIDGDVTVQDFGRLPTGNQSRDASK